MDAASHETGGFPAVQFLSTRQAADLLGVSHRTVENWRGAGSGPPYVMVGGSLRYLLSDVVAWAVANRRIPERDVV